MLAYGDYGAGKTRLVGSSVLVPQMRDVLFVDCEAGDLTIATESDEAYAKAASEFFDVVRVQNFSQLARVHEFLKLHCQYRDEGNTEALKTLELKLMPEVDPDRPPRMYRTAIIDSLSEAETYSIYSLLGITSRTRLDEETMDAGWPEFRKNQSQVLRLIRGFRDLPMHILMTAAAQFSQDEAKRMIWTPMLTGQLSKKCQGFMDIVGYMYVTQEEGKPIHNMQVQPSPRINAKCRFSNFKLLGWRDPTLLSILSGVGLLDKTLKQVPSVAPSAAA